MSETIILAIIACSCIVVVALIIAVGVLIYNYQDNKGNLSMYAGFSVRCDALDKRMDNFVTRMTELEIKVDNSQKE